MYSRRRDEASILRLSPADCRSLSDCLPNVSQSVTGDRLTVLQLVSRFDAFANEADAAQKIKNGAVALNEIRFEV